MSDGGFKERDAEAPRPPTPVMARLFEDIQLPVAQPMLEPAHGLGPPDPMALLDWMDDGPATAPSNLLGFGTNQAGSAPIQLNPNAPRKQLPRGGPGPQLPADDLARVGDTMEAQRLLTSKELQSGQNATKAMEILNEVPEGQRGKAIDGLNDKAFENLLDRVPHGDREKFEKLVEASQDPKRKLKLWAEFHKSRARNDLGKLKGDVGQDDPKAKQDVEDLTRGPDEPERDSDEYEFENADIERKRKQERSFDRHKRRIKAVSKTHEEVDLETKRLLEMGEKGQLTLAQVDEMRKRKDLEYRIERDNNLNLTAEGERGETDKEPVIWDTPELERVQTTLARLPEGHVREPKVFANLNRKKSPHIMDGTGGVHHGDTIDITDRGASRGPGYKHGGDAREMVSKEFRREHGDTITAIEYVLTHEVGHDVAQEDKKAFEKFKKAAGWQETGVDALRKDHVTEEDIAELEKARPDPNAKQLNIGGERKTYSPIKDQKNFWGVDRTAIPEAPKAIVGTGCKAGGQVGLRARQSTGALRGGVRESGPRPDAAPQRARCAARR